MRVVLLLAIVLAGCSSPSALQPHCVLPYEREAGLGLKLPACHAWVFGNLPE